MRLPLLPLLFLVLPLAEIAGFVVVGSEIGVLATIALILATTVLGAVLLRIQGLGAMDKMKDALRSGVSPGRDMVHAVMIMLAGILLILPGFISDAFGILLFIPPVREAVWRFLSSRIIVVNAAGGYTGGFSRRSSQTIDLDEDDYRRDDDHRDPPSRPRLPNDL
ncbi:FxsA family protein [Aquamicrobium zhengzhouense]|uniref:Membrane protein FxsA n=1 Tax=Aquamicrobium zhengzhouense TaxID=2781738 RepID=A0ABS0SHI4_9HYPH|nr:FxsA family protein [Aquamicrobium zhengzhouense]MBI1622151.1 membrane protein FxsA [Aquamicrobium zhengzhouense]